MGLGYEVFWEWWYQSMIYITYWHCLDVYKYVIYLTKLERNPSQSNIFQSWISLQIFVFVILQASLSNAWIWSKRAYSNLGRNTYNTFIIYIYIYIYILWIVALERPWAWYIIVVIVSGISSGNSFAKYMQFSYIKYTQVSLTFCLAVTISSVAINVFICFV